MSRWADAIAAYEPPPITHRLTMSVRVDVNPEAVAGWDDCSASDAAGAVAQAIRQLLSDFDGTDDARTTRIKIRELPTTEAPDVDA